LGAKVGSSLVVVVAAAMSHKMMTILLAPGVNA
jgi:hypothetical protein